MALLTGCASTTSASQTPVSDPAPQNVTLVLWHGWSGPARQALSSLVDEFNRQHPSGRVFAQSMPLTSMPNDLRAAATAGSGPHLALIPNTWIGGLARDQVIVPLDDLVSKEQQQAMLPATLGGAQATDAAGKSHLYGMPVSFDTLALFYNRANVDAPQNTATMLQIARGLSEPSATPPRWGLALNLSVDTTMGYLYAFSGRVFDEQGKPVIGSSGRAGTEQWLAWLKTLHTDPQLMAHPDGSLEQERSLKNGNVFMTFGWAHELADYHRLWDTNMGVAPLPTLSETNAAPQPYVQSDVLVINSRVSDAERKVAVAFLQFMTSKDTQAKLLASYVQPACRAVPLDGDTPDMAAARAFRAAAEHGQPMPNTPTRDAVQQVLRIMQRQVLAGNATPADAVSDAQTRLQALVGQP
jgi:ABC-type glycerol-3-phosphate transport system substrate-binding protein